MTRDGLAQLGVTVEHNVTDLGPSRRAATVSQLGAPTHVAPLQRKLALSQALCNAAGCSAPRGSRNSSRAYFTGANRPPSTRQAKCFDVFGADFLITSDLSPVLMEINAAPELSMPKSDIIRGIRTNFFRDLIRTCVAPRTRCSRGWAADAARAAADRRFDALLSRFRAGRTCDSECAASLRRMHAIDEALARGAAFDECPVDAAICPLWGEPGHHRLYRDWRAFVKQE